MDDSMLRKKRFAEIFACCVDCELAAELTGSTASSAREDGMALLSGRYVRKHVQKLMREKRELAASVRSGLERLAFSRCNDAVALAFSPPDAISQSRIRKMDLSCIASIKRDKDGGVDIKLFDRGRALEALMRLDESESHAGGAQELISALSEQYEDGGDSE